jgi:hypothetical protein
MTDLAARLFRTVAAAAIGGWLLWAAIMGLRTDQARGRFTAWTRKKTPALFWTVVIVQVLLSMGCLALAVDAWIGKP